MALCKPTRISSGAVSPHDPGDAEHDAGDDAGERGRDHDLHDRLPLRDAERVRRLPQLGRDEASISSVVRMITGTISRTSASETAKPCRRCPKVVIQAAYTKSAATMEGCR
jgi:hypothetical protein